MDPIQPHHSNRFHVLAIVEDLALIFLVESLKSSKKRKTSVEIERILKRVLIRKACDTRFFGSVRIVPGQIDS